VKYHLIIVTLLFCFTGISALGGEYSVQEVTYSKKYNLKGYLALPKGNGPFPVAVYHHGGLGLHIGGQPKETSVALAKAGFIGFAPLRRKTKPMSDAIDDANAAMSFVYSLPSADRKQIAVLGFSRGGHLAFYTGARDSNVKAMVIMACAPGRRNQNEFFVKVRDVEASVLLLVAENDNERTDLVALMRKIKQTLDESKKDSKLIVYPPYKSDGHRMFFEIGSYWKDVIAFLSDKITFIDKAIDSNKN